MITILLRCIIVYTLLALSLRLTGKRQIGELEISELITTLLFSELAALPVTDPDIPIAYVIVPICMLGSIEIVLTYFTSKNPKLKAIIGGKPNAVIKNGKIDQKELKKLRMSISELLVQLRMNGVTDPAKVRYAFFEEDGQVCVIDDQTEYVYSLICDGSINRFNLIQSGWSEKRLMKYLEKKKSRVKDILLMTVDDNGRINIIYKEE